MENSLLKKLLPHGIALVLMVVLSFTFFAPYAFDGRVLQQDDNDKATASQVEMDSYKAKTGKYPLWTGAYFSGMPTVQIHQEIHSNYTQPIFRAALLNQPLTAPHTEALLCMLCMYILLLACNVDWRIALTGAAAFGLSSFNMDIIEAGHSTKMVALGYAPLVVAGSVLAFRKKYLLGAGIFGLAVALQLYANHYQITYYTFIMLMIMGIAELVVAIRNKELGDFAKSVACHIVALAFGVGSNAAALWTTQEYQSETQRGKTELTKRDDKNTSAEGGVSFDYATGWSCGIGESMSLLVQNAYGGGASQTHAGTDTYEKVAPQVLSGIKGVSADKAKVQADKQISSLFYTGDQPFVGVSIYWGAVFIFLFLTGMFLLEGPKKWGFAAATLVMLMIAWGKNFFFYGLMFDYFPLFNKFRAPTQAFGLGLLVVIALASITLQAFFDPSVSAAKKKRSLMIGGGVTALLCLIAMMGGGAGKNDGQLQAELLSFVKDDRVALARADAMRSLFLVAASAGLLWMLVKGNLKSWMAIAGIGILTVGDFWTIGKRILYDEKFEDKATLAKTHNAQPADLKIMEDKDPNFRVLDLRGGDPFSNAATSAFHKSVGGYHSAKLMVYQEMIAEHLSKFEQNVPILGQKIMPLYGMLNAKYIILDDSQAGVQMNPLALGNAWFVKNLQIVKDADAEIAEVGKINPRYDVVMQQKHAAAIGATASPQYDSTATIKMTTYTPDKIDYETSAKSEQIAVFSEIYYPMEKGWNMTIDGQPAVFGKANYCVRAAKIPAGNHKISFEFRPKSYYTGETISMIASSLLLFLLLGGLFLHFRQNGLPDAATIPEQLEAEKPEKAELKPRAAVTPTPSVAKPKLTEKKKK
jgi:Bacterial membrane protein YfhO